ncbi:MAG: carbohydrate ABC transporter permease [Anaerolineae bacterium]|nr:carbohydrate ABC transporter permease [Anaerolineae bacterium]
MAEETRRSTVAVASVVQTKPRLFQSKRFQERFTSVMATILATIGAMFILFPVAWMVSTSLKSEIEALKMPPVWIPAKPQWHNYRDALTFNPFGTYFKNTAFYAITVMIGEALSCSFIAYGFARLRAPGRNALFLLVLSTMMVPYQVTLIPQYILFSKLHWLNSYKPLIIPGWFGSAYLIFLLRQFYMTLPKEYDEAAIIDGATPLGIWFRIILPLSKPALGAVSIMSFMYHWNNYLGPLVYINDNSKFTVSLGLSMFRTPFGGTPWHWLMAASLAVVSPCVVVFFVAQRYFIQGIVISGVKG